MKKSVKILLVLSVVLIAAALFLLFARPLVRVVKERNEKGNIKWNLVITGLSFREFHAGDPLDSNFYKFEKLENGEWKACAFTPEGENVRSGLYLWYFNHPGMTRAVFPDFGFVYDLSAPGKYRVLVTIGNDVKFEHSFTLTRQFRVD